MLKRLQIMVFHRHAARVILIVGAQRVVQVVIRAGSIQARVAVGVVSGRIMSGARLTATAAWKVRLRVGRELVLASRGRESIVEHPADVGLDGRIDTVARLALVGRTRLDWTRVLNNRVEAAILGRIVGGEARRRRGCRGTTANSLNRSTCYVGVLKRIF